MPCFRVTVDVTMLRTDTYEVRAENDRDARRNYVDDPSPYRGEDFDDHEEVFAVEEIADCDCVGCIEERDDGGDPGADPPGWEDAK